MYTSSRLTSLITDRKLYALCPVTRTTNRYASKAKDMKAELAALDAYAEQADVIANDLDKLGHTMGR